MTDHPEGAAAAGGAVPDLRTSYLGMPLANPIVASSSPLTGDLDTLHQLAGAGAAAVVLPSLFEEQVEHDGLEAELLETLGANAYAEALSGYLPELDGAATVSENYVELVRRAKDEIDIPVIASLNGTTRGGWVRHAKLLQEAGADAIELNVYLIPTDPYATGAEIEARYLALVESVRAAVAVPLAVKIGPYFSSLANMANRLAEAGADGLTLFNRFYQPDIDLDLLDVAPDLVLSRPDELRLPLRWVAILAFGLRADLAVTTGVHDAAAVIKAMLAGANVAMMAAALLRNGPGHITSVLDEVSTWLVEHDYESIHQMRGSMAMNRVPNPDGYIRANYMRMLRSYVPQNAV